VSRIAGRFEQLASSGRKALISYVVAGDPAPEATVPLLHALVENGADILELGVPFSDPMAEGPVIQLGHERALANGTSLRSVIDMVREFRTRDADTPVLLMGYANPVEHMGYERFVAAASEAGVDALLTVDLPPEEVGALNTLLQGAGMDNIFLVAPTTPADRVGRITARASGFIYYVSLKGVTGAGHLDVEDVTRHLALIRERTALPVAVGFGIRDAASARAVAGVADGVVVGSAIVDCLAKAIDAGGDQAAAIEAAGTLLAEIRRGVDSATAF